jgi:hypothetical protein
MVASLLGRPKEKYREAILVGFLNGEDLPELAVDLPSKLSRLMSSKTAWAEIALIVVAIATALFAAIDSEAIRDAIRLPPTVATFLLAAGLIFSGLAVVAGYLLWFGAQSGAAQRRGWLKSFLSRLGNAERAVLPQFFAALGLCVTVADGALGSDDRTFPGRVLIALLTLAWTRRSIENPATLWAPVIVILSMSTGWFYGLLLLWPLIAALARRYSWQQLRSLLIFTSPAMLLGLPVGPQIGMSSNLPLLIALGLLGRLISDTEYRDRNLSASILIPEDILVLLLPLGISVGLALENVAALNWYPHPLLATICFLIGLSRVRLRIILTLLLVAGIVFGLLHLVMSWQEFGGRLVRIGHVFLWPNGTISMFVALMCGYLLRQDTAVLRLRLIQLSSRSWIVDCGFAGMLMILIFSLGVVLTLPSLVGRNQTFGSTLLYDFAVLAVAVVGAVYVSRPILSILAIVLGSGGLIVGSVVSGGFTGPTLIQIGDVSLSLHKVGWPPLVAVILALAFSFLLARRHLVPRVVEVHVQATGPVPA